ncbi:hypothetical protein CYQ32_03735 [Enterococcus faecalis]|uniref:hypothetical protein n=1 Tax=Enterococcus faecalis TaxID=1351 RepID=UPI00100E5C82|nr:hypothetical protein [Enterococcus faecalis]RXV32343.1 hypothetical protein CYQ32_03735 [Enterococcus faecalis]
MKKSVSILLMLVAVITLTACGSKLDKTGEEFKKKIIVEYNYEDLKDEKNFSFLIYKDKDTNRYLADVWVPVDKKPSAVEYFYFYNEDKFLDESESKTAFDDMKASGNYEVVYKSGKFK